MIRHAIATLCLAFGLTAALPAQADPQAGQKAEPRRGYLGHGRLVVNDVIGDRLDRWRTGSVVASHVFGPDWTGSLPGTPFEILEFRIMGEIIAPERLNGPTPGDRPYATSWSLGLHTHFDHAGWDVALGADAVVTGPQTGLSDVQATLHDIAGIAPASAAVLGGQIGNGFHLSGVAEVGRDLDLGPARLRPFAELRWGVEDMLRVGFDVSFGPAGRGELLVRDPVTGHRYRSVYRAGDGVSFVVGADVAKVWDSLWLPAATHSLTDARTRVRGGVHYQRGRFAGFYGLTWLGPEFAGQREGQLVGAVRLRIEF